MKKSLTLLSLVLIGLSSNALAGRNGKSQQSSSGGCTVEDWKDEDWGTGVVVRTVDGDTVKIRAKNKTMNIRMLSIDTPETHYQGKTQGYWGDAAAAELARQLPIGSEIRMELGAEKCDKYGRLLAHVWRGETNVNLRMLELGMAVNYCIYPNAMHCEEYSQAVKLTSENKTGIFSDESLELPYVWRVKIDNRKFEKPVGDIRTHEVFSPEKYSEIPAYARVFFFRWDDVKAPFKRVEEQQ